MPAPVNHFAITCGHTHRRSLCSCLCNCCPWLVGAGLPRLCMFRTAQIGKAKPPKEAKLRAIVTQLPIMSCVKLLSQLVNITLNIQKYKASQKLFCFFLFFDVKLASLMAATLIAYPWEHVISHHFSTFLVPL